MSAAQSSNYQHTKCYELNHFPPFRTILVILNRWMDLDMDSSANIFGGV